MRLIPLIFLLMSCGSQSDFPQISSPQQRVRAADLKQQDLCSGELYKDIKHGICWYRSSWGNAAIGFVISCDLYDQCAKEGYFD